MQGLLLDPEILRWLEVISENADNFLNLVVAVLIHEEVAFEELATWHPEFHLHLSATGHSPSGCKAFVLVLWVELKDDLRQLI